MDIAGELVAPHTVDLALDHIQIALNYPPYPYRPGGPHVDGHRPGQPRPHSFTMLGAIYLVDEQEHEAGNLWVWPGSHLDHQRLFQERGAHALLAVSGHSTMLDPPPSLREQVPVLARRGDLLLAHYLIGHNTGGNTTDRVRRIAYYRLGCEGHQGRWEDTFLDALAETRRSDSSSPANGGNTSGTTLTTPGPPSPPAPPTGS